MAVRGNQRSGEQKETGHFSHLLKLPVNPIKGRFIHRLPRGYPCNFTRGNGVGGPDKHMPLKYSQYFRGIKKELLIN